MVWVVLWMWLWVKTSATRGIGSFSVVTPMAPCVCFRIASSMVTLKHTDRCWFMDRLEDLPVAGRPSQYEKSLDHRFDQIVHVWS